MHRLFFLITLFFILANVQSLLYSQSGESDPGVQLVDSYVAAGNITKALVELENILVKNPANLEAQEMKINILVQQDRGKEAFKDIEEYMVMYPNKPEYFYLRAILNLQKEKYSKAIDDFDKAVQTKMPENSVYKVYLNRGMAHFYLQDYDLAEADFNEVIDRDSKNAAAYHGKGMVKYELREYDEAVVQFQKALHEDEGNPITHFNMGMTYFRLDESDNACYHFNRSCTLGHRNACRLLMMECTEEINISK
ncbi:MAG: tetratricopeptide repeat protein [Bacteroidales bacterium]|nr:tetratricopeptide repeat protein [Bacteroidales bacterium]